jgi:hypothetical protein
MVLFDWEFAAWGLPQRDVIEFLLFTSGGDRGIERAQQLMDLHYESVQAALETELDAALWRRSYRAAFHDFITQRLPFYFILSQFQRCDYLDRVLHAIESFIRNERILFHE